MYIIGLVTVALVSHFRIRGEWDLKEGRKHYIGHRDRDTLYYQLYLTKEVI